MASPLQPKFEELEGEVLSFLLARTDVQESVGLALAGNQEEATASILGILKGLLPSESIPQPKAKIAKSRARPPEKRPETSPEEEPTAKRAATLTSRYWLEECTEALEEDRLGSEEKARAKRISATRALLSPNRSPQPAPDELGGSSTQQAPAVVPLYWRIDLPEVSKVLTQRGVLPGTFLPVVKPHATLLYIGGESSDERAASRAGLTLTKYRASTASLRRLRGTVVSVKMVEIIIEENVACALVSLPSNVPCASKVPHVTLGTRHGVPARHANDVLEEVLAGRQEGVTRIKLPKPKELKGILELETGARTDETSR
eukprot:TRINITY_DN97215_c0_g1_i1.p1 TRINITY_DN97215_c0_g1~~TRINITY_DN97215_c0_g1_i1.p1  ORF type:complete len:334 (-),score=61.85 TRINITY_DN97215_c0_g1_i1:83-1033(-)